jgi:hypothetical protein
VFIFSKSFFQSSFSFLVFYFSLNLYIDYG